MRADRVRRSRLGALAALALLASCRAVPPPPAPPPAPAPASTPTPIPAPAPTPTPVPASDWDVAPVAPGDWHLRREGADSLALFGASEAAADLAIRCVASTGRIALEWRLAGGPARPITIRTSYGALQWAAAPSPAQAGQPGGLEAERPAGDAGFDWIAYSRGRIALEAAGAERLVVPVWAEIARVVEDCRN